MREIGDYGAMIFALDAVKIFIQKVVRENSVQIAPNFPAKSLVRNIFLDLIENYSVCLLVTKENYKKKYFEYETLFIKYIIENNKKDNN